MIHLHSTITLCNIFSQEPSCVAPRSAQTLLPPFPIKNEILGFKKDRSRSKAISFLFIYIYIFQSSTNNTKKIICLNSKTCHYCQMKVTEYIWTFEYNSKIKYKHSNLRLKHYLHYKVRWKGANKSYKTCYFGLRIPNMQSFL